MTRDEAEEFYNCTTINRMANLCGDVGYNYVIQLLDATIKERKETAMDTLHPIIAAALRPYIEPVDQTVRDSVIDTDYYLVDVRRNLIVEHLGESPAGGTSFFAKIDHAVVTGLTAKLHGWCN